MYNPNSCVAIYLALLLWSIFTTHRQPPHPPSLFLLHKITMVYASFRCWSHFTSAAGSLLRFCCLVLDFCCTACGFTNLFWYLYLYGSHAAICAKNSLIIWSLPATSTGVRWVGVLLSFRAAWFGNFLENNRWMPCTEKSDYMTESCNVAELAGKSCCQIFVEDIGHSVRKPQAGCIAVVVEWCIYLHLSLCWSVKQLLCGD